MMKTAKFISVLLLASALNLAWPGSGSADNKTVGQGAKKTLYLVCSDQPWYPFVYSNTEVMGIHIDMVRKALELAGYEARIEAMPMARCIKMAERNMVDGIISIAYEKGYARFLEYPQGSAEARESQWRIMQVDDVVVTAADDPFEFDGDVSSLPQPVRVFKAEPIISELREIGLEIEASDTNWLNYAKFLRDKRGCLVTTSVVADKMEQDSSFKDKVFIQATPLKSRSYYLAFCWGSRLSREERELIWSEIAQVRDDYVFMLTTFGKY